MGKGKNNLAPKIFSILIAIILWSYVMGRENPEWPRDYKNVDVTFTNIEVLNRQNLVVMEPQEAKVNVSVTGRKSDMGDFTAGENIVAKLDLSGYGEGQNRIPILVSLKDSASTVRITDWEPSDILVSIDRIVREEKTVNIRTEGSVGNDYSLGDIVSKPQTVLLRGPRSWVNEVSEVFAVVNISGRTTTANITSPIQLENHNGEDVVGLEKIPSVIEISVPVFRKATLPIEVVLENELPEDYVITEMEVEPSFVTLRGGNTIADLTSIKTQAVDPNLFLENPSLEVELDLPENIELMEANQRIVINTTVENVARKEFQYDFSEIDIRNLDEDLEIDELNETIRVLVSGTESFIETISKEDIRPYIDAKNFAAREYEVDLKIDEIEDLTIDFIEPESLTISLTRR